MDRKNCFVVKHVLPGSIAEEAGIEPGDSILAVNDETIKDIFDYRFLAANEELQLEIMKASGEEWCIEIEKDEYEDLGMEFENPMLDEAKSCTNRCIFCFIDQLPGGMRETLYFKDDDSRLSFLTGNYVTLTNVSLEDLDRIIRYRMSPINVSVHTTNPDLRVFMLKNRFAGEVLDRIKRLTEGSIKVNCQIVLCRGINDGEELERTLEDLCRLYPGVNSISAVPVGITKFREGLMELVPYDKLSSIQVIEKVENWQRKLLKKYGSRVVYLADEFYIMAGRELPEYIEYEDFPQIENGVGLISQLRYEFDEAFGMLGEIEAGSRKVSIATGVSSFKFIKGLAEKLENRFAGLSVKVYEIKNEFFGENVTVAGLLTGRDVFRQLKDKDLGEELLICRCMLRSGEEVFLDDFTVGDMEQGLDIRVTVVENSGRDFIDAVLKNGGV